jgi:hypothetical protein
LVTFTGTVKFPEQELLTRPAVVVTGVGGVVTVRVAAPEVTGEGHVPETMQRYLYPLRPCVAEVMLNVEEFTPE